MRRQFPVFDRWNKRALGKMVDEWTMEIPDLANNMLLDRLIFVHENTAFTAGSWDDEDGYTWINVNNGSEYTPKLDNGWKEDVRVLMPYTYDGEEVAPEEDDEDEEAAGTDDDFGDEDDDMEE